MMRVSSAHLSSEIAVQILSSRKISFSFSMDFILRCFDKRLLLRLPLPPLLLSRRPGSCRFVEATVSRCTLEGLTFVSTLFESCEPYSWYSTVWLGRFEAHIIEVPFLLAQFWTVIYHPRIIENSFGNSPEFSMMVLALGDNFEFLLAILMVPIVSFPPWSFINSLSMKWYFSVTKFSSVRDSSKFNNLH